MIVRYHDALQPVEEDILRRMSRAFGGVLQVPIISRMTLQNKSVLHFGDQVVFALEGSALKMFSIPTFPCKDRRKLADQMSDAAIPAGLRPYARRERETQIAVADLLRHLSRIQPVVEACPWLPEQLSVLQTLEEIS
jgi:hypothetical protein